MGHDVTFSLVIESGNQAFQDGGAGPEIARLLRLTADRVEHAASDDRARLNDVNGNKVGDWSLCVEVDPTCESCGCEIIDGEGVGCPNGDFVCNDCFEGGHDGDTMPEPEDEDEPVQCYDCGGEVKPGEGFEIRDSCFVCPECRETRRARIDGVPVRVVIEDEDTSNVWPKDLQDVRDAVDAGLNVRWANDAYEVHKSGGEYLVTYRPNNHTVGLIGVGRLELFYIKSTGLESVVLDLLSRYAHEFEEDETINAADFLETYAAIRPHLQRELNERLTNKTAAPLPEQSESTRAHRRSVLFEYARNTGELYEEFLQAARNHNLLLKAEDFLNLTQKAKAMLDREPCDEDERIKFSAAEILAVAGELCEHYEDEIAEAVRFAG